MNDTARAFAEEPRWLSIPDRWMIHAYYTISPFAPDGSGRIVAAAANIDLPEPIGEVVILDRDGVVLDRFGRNRATPSFWHTGFWQCFSPDARYVYYQSGTMKEPGIVRRELASGAEIRVEGDMEGIPPSGEPGLSAVTACFTPPATGRVGSRPSRRRCRSVRATGTGSRRSRSTPSPAPGSC